MAGIYSERHPEHTVFYRVFFYYFERFLREYEHRFEKEYGYFRPVIQEVVERYLDCSNPMCGFACIRCPDCGEERLLMFSCKTREFCPSCHAKRREEWGEWIREQLLLDVPHRQVVFTIPKMLRLFFRFKRKLLNSLCLSAVRTLVKFLHTATGLELMPGVVAVIQTFGDRINFHPHVHVLITEGGQPRMVLFTVSVVSMMMLSKRSSPMRSSPCFSGKNSSAFLWFRRSSAGATQVSTSTARSGLRPRER